MIVSCTQSSLINACNYNYTILSAIVVENNSRFCYEKKNILQKKQQPI